MGASLEVLARRVVRAERVTVRRWAALQWFDGSKEQRRKEALYERAADRRAAAFASFELAQRAEGGAK